MACRIVLSIGLSLVLCLTGLADARPLGEYYHVTRDQPLVKAVWHLERSDSARAIAAYIFDNNVKVMFKDLREIGKAYRKHDALSWIDPLGRQYVFVHQRHMSAPPQALAAIISHEVMHNDEFNSHAEELAGWTQELRTWQEMIVRYPVLGEIPNGKIPLVDRLNALQVLNNQQKLKETVYTHKSYQGLPEHSPGF